MLRAFFIADFYPRCTIGVMNASHNIYIHVPFCISKCKYCAFFSRACASPDWDSYAEKIIHEIKHWRNILGRVSVPTIFFGGGTPSLLPTKIFAKIMDAIHENFELLPNAEITIEANPKTLDSVRLREFCDGGVNRISIGVQSFDDEKLKFLGRAHNADDARRLIDAAMATAKNVSADFIYGLPSDNTHDVIKTCNEINRIGLQHCSMYELTIEPDTPFGKMNLEMPTNDEMAEMYNAISKTLKLKRYEVSNYAAKGAECRHNQNVWDGEPYIGIGDGAAGRILINNEWYEELGGGKLFEKLSDSHRAIERVITGMRTRHGVMVDETIKKIIDIEFAKSHPDMLEFKSDNRICATDAGILGLDKIIERLVK
ncbi:MAG: radical SAM family heme chaperone HemW [Alphaproteobacteria bacterium]|nr:radical SAM family heme chaperone HemW [Alphaproteobacteria bacterium]